MGSKNGEPTTTTAPARRGPGRPVEEGLADRRRRQLVEAAFTVFAERGYHNSGITEIMQEAKLGRGTFYLYFQNKREILDSVLDYIIEQILSAIGAQTDPSALRTKADFEQFFRSVAARLFDLLDENPDLTTVVIRNGTIDEAITARMLSLADAFAATITVFVHQGVATGVLDPDVDAAAVAHGLTGFAIGGLLRGVRGDFTPSERERYVDTAVAVFSAFARDTAKATT
ncbi:TetR/AcrR family transcriptional regulator [Antrihabitans sp. YC2-6]|uniref:TetR/AcrR family transcriptional regulator n=1 Tax=Antrihabitans sp. YC2-6 TaxID=2799498 RepID=UPI0018F4E9F8|nr:TetR/AcrR family transcriptional regulator [Antrihabitans sp. YC2-6]MBJ8343519.1 TetR/AcrR family transcriptional regulator [Antrihabitans sp. YC2-6]